MFDQVAPVQVELLGRWNIFSEKYKYQVVKVKVKVLLCQIPSQYQIEYQIVKVKVKVGISN